MVIGLTGGIGSGKTTVANMFKKLGVPIYIADVEAKKLMLTSKIIQRKLKALFGEETYINETLNKIFLASKIFNDKSLLKKMNAIVHPKVASHFKRWLKKQDTPYVIKESAIIFENNLTAQYNYIITVVADEELRIKRVTKRDDSNKSKIKAIIKNQLSDADKIKKSDFVIYNNELDDCEKQVKEIDKLLRLKLLK